MIIKKHGKVELTPEPTNDKQIRCKCPQCGTIVVLSESDVIRRGRLVPLNHFGPRPVDECWECPQCRKTVKIEESVYPTPMEKLCHALSSVARLPVLLITGMVYILRHIKYSIIDDFENSHSLCEFIEEMLMKYVVLPAVTIIAICLVIGTFLAILNASIYGM